MPSLLRTKKGRRKVSSRTYILYDSRAWGGETDEASVLVVCEDNEEACEYKGDYGGMACFSYAEQGDQLIDERHEWNWYPGDPV